MDNTKEHYEVKKIITIRRYKNSMIKYKLKWKG